MNDPSPENATKNALIEAAIAELAANPAASLSEIANAAGVKRVTLHRLIGTRDDLLRDIAIRSMAEMETACDEAAKSAPTAIAALRAIVEALVPVGDRCHFLWHLSGVWEEQSVAKESARQDQEMFALIDLAKKEGSIPSDIPNAWILASIISVVYTALRTARAGDIAVNDAGKLAVRTLFDGIEAKSKQNKK